MNNDFAERLREFALKIARIKDHCPSEEATKIYMVLPFLAMLGYDITDPASIVPEHDADLHPAGRRKVDFAIVRDGLPAIAVEVKSVGASLAEARGQLRSYFNALSTARLAIATNGTTYEFFVDSESANLMDAEPFLTLDLEAVAAGIENPDTVALLDLVREPSYEPGLLVERAVTSLLRQRIKTLLLEEFRAPSDELCRLLLMKLDLRNVRAQTIDQHYRPLIRAAIEEALVLPVLESLRRLPPTAAEGGAEEASMPSEPRVVTTSGELEMFDAIKERLALLVRSDEEFAAIGRLSYRDFIGKFAVYLDRERKGRLFDYIELGEGRHRFVFPDLGLDLAVQRFDEIDGPLYSAFTRKLGELRQAA
jgi:hypothetical protein